MPVAGGVAGGLLPVAAGVAGGLLPVEFSGYNDLR